MVKFDYITDDNQRIYYSNISNRIISVVVEVYECFTDTLIFSNQLELHPNYQYLTFMPQAWKNRKVLIIDKDSNQILLPIWVDGKMSLKDIDKFGYIEKLLKIKKNVDHQEAIHSTLSEHFIHRTYGGYVDVEKGDVVIDIGFNFGVFCLRALNNGASKIYGFEPNIDVYKIGKQVYADITKVEIFNFAVGKKNEKVVFMQGKSSLISSTYGAVSDYEYSYEIDSINLPDFLFFRQIDKIDFLKIDCEGSEYDIFESIPDHIFSKIKKVHVEFHYNDGKKVEMLIEKLNRNNFEWRFDPDTTRESPIGMIYAKQKEI